MTVQEINDIIHATKKSYDYTSAELLRYINTIEAKIYMEIISKCYTSNDPRQPVDLRGDNPLNMAPAAHLNTYDLPPVFRKIEADEVNTRELIVPMPYDELYLRYVEYRLAIKANDDHVNNAELLYQQAYNEFHQWYLTTHRPIREPLRSRRVIV